MRRRLAVLCGLIVFTSFGFGQGMYPGKEWREAPGGLSPEVRKQVEDFVRASDTSSLVVVKGGKVIYHYGDVKQLSYLASARKSVLSMLYGKYVENGTIDLSKTLDDLGMDDNGGLLPIEKTARVEDLIEARSGVFHPASNQGDLLSLAPKRGSVTPGTFWLYSNWDFNAAGGAFEKMTGKNLFDCLRDDVAGPIGMQDFRRNRQLKLGDLKASRYPAYHMWLSTRDMARLGYLMLRKGKWDGRQIVPERWVEKSTSVITPLSEMQPPEARNGPWGYGYMWWVWDGPFNSGPFKGAFTARGAFGQFITVLPALDMVVAHKTVPVNRSVPDYDYLLLLDRIVGRRPVSEVVLETLVNGGREAALAQFNAIRKESPTRVTDSDLFTAGVTATRARDFRRAEQALSLNLALYPRSARTLLALGRAQAAAGKRAAAVATLNRIPKTSFMATRGRVELARLGEKVEGHSLVASPFRGVVRFKNKDVRLVVHGGRTLHVQEFDPLGDQVDDYELFADRSGGFYGPADGYVVTFEYDARHRPVRVVKRMGKDTLRAERY